MTLSIKEVTKVIQSVGTGNSFNVTFVKKDGTERTFFGCTLEGNLKVVTKVNYHRHYQSRSLKMV